MPPRVAAVTMTYNERAYLPVWARHYTRQVGHDHCYVIDHGSTEIIALPPGVNYLRIPRSPHDDQRRALFISSFVESLLEYYDYVIHTDVDELVMADPAQYANLPAFCRSIQLDTVTAIGFDIQQVPPLEPPLLPDMALGQQRGWCRFTSAMCKPVLTRKPIVWSPGFHCADGPICFAPLYLFHLHWADQAIGIERLSKTRTMPWGDPSFGAHQRITDLHWTALFEGMAAFKRNNAVSFDPTTAPLSTWLDKTRRSALDREGELYTLDLHINAPELWAIPARFRARL